MADSRYRVSPEEIDAAQRARALLYEIDNIHWNLAEDDPLRRSLHVAHRVLALGLGASPVLRVEQPSTLLEQQLPHGEEALARVGARAEATETLLQSLYERALDMPQGRASRRKALIDVLVQAASHLRAVLRGETRAGIVVPHDATPEGLHHELQKLCSVIDCAMFDDVDSMPKFLLSFAAGVSRDFFMAYGIELPVSPVMNALVGLIQEEERLLEAESTERSGRRTEGAVPYIDALLGLLDLAALQGPRAADDRDAREKAVDLLGKDLRAARARTRKLDFRDAPTSNGCLTENHEDSTPPGCADGRGSGTSA